MLTPIGRMGMEESGEEKEGGGVNSETVLEFRDELSRNVSKMEQMLQKFKVISEALNHDLTQNNDYEISTWQRSKGGVKPHHASDSDFRPNRERKSFLESDSASARKAPIKSESSSSFTKLFNDHPYPSHHCPDHINLTTTPP